MILLKLLSAGKNDNVSTSDKETIIMLLLVVEILPQLFYVYISGLGSSIDCIDEHR